MRKIDTRPVHFRLSVLSFGISSLSIAFMPFIFLSVLPAVVFWLGFAAGIIFTFFFTKQRAWDKKYIDPGGRLPAFLRFFSNRIAAVFDLLLIIGVGTIAVSYSTVPLPEFINWLTIFTAVLSLEMHCIFNGKNYAWLRAKRADAKKTSVQ